MLALATQIFDPISYFCFETFILKTLMQECCHKNGYDIIDYLVLWRGNSQSIILYFLLCSQHGFVAHIYLREETNLM